MRTIFSMKNEPTTFTKAKPFSFLSFFSQESRFEGSSWEWNEKRQQFYYHQFGIRQPDLNFRNEDLKQEIKVRSSSNKIFSFHKNSIHAANCIFQNIIKFWLDKGISGFRLDAARYFIEDALLRDEPPKDLKPMPLFTRNDFHQIYTRDLWESYELIHEIRQFIDDYTRNADNKNERYILTCLLGNNFRNISRGWL